MKKVNFVSMTKKSFCNWTPKMPKHKVVIDKTSYRAPHQVWNLKDAEKVEITHRPPLTGRDNLAYYMMRGLRYSFDFFTKYQPGKMNENLYLRRCIFLETVAGVPGMIGGMVRHMASLRTLREDGGWIHHLLEEAENERMHLLTFLKIRQPNFLERICIAFAQFIFVIYYSLLYLTSYKMAHRFVGYLEEEAVKTYTNLIKEIDEGRLPEWSNLPASPEAIRYWVLPEDAKIRDVFIAIRADEVAHREFNHRFADINKFDRMSQHQYYIKDGKFIIWDESEQSNISEQSEEKNLKKSSTEIKH